MSQLRLDLTPRRTGFPSGCCQACGTRLDWMPGGSGLEPHAGGDHTVDEARRRAVQVPAGEGTHRRHFDHCAVLAGKLARLHAESEVSA